MRVWIFMKKLSVISRYLQSYLEQRPLFLSLIRAKEAEFFSRFMPFAHPVLDVGCGDGFFASVLFGQTMKSHGRRIDVGLDVPDSRLSQASSMNIYTSLLSYDGHVMPFASRRFGTVISNCVLEHIPNIEEVVSEVYRVLKPGGTFVVSVMAHPWEEHLAGSLILGNSYKRWMRKKQVHFNLFTHKKWSELFVNAGFTLEQQIGYLNPAACRVIDIAHYLSIPSLLSYVLWKKWVIWPKFAHVYPISYLSHIIASDVPVDESGALFYVLRKPR